MEELLKKAASGNESFLTSDLSLELREKIMSNRLLQQVIIETALNSTSENRIKDRFKLLRRLEVEIRPDFSWEGILEEEKKRLYVVDPRIKSANMPELVLAGKWIKIAVFKVMKHAKLEDIRALAICHDATFLPPEGLLSAWQQHKSLLPKDCWINTVDLNYMGGPCLLRNFRLCREGRKASVELSYRPQDLEPGTCLVVQLSQSPL